MRPIFRYRAAGPVLMAAAMSLAGGCARHRPDPPVSPHENVLSIAAEFALLSTADPYRDPPGRDLLGDSIARATMARLGNYEALYPGRFAPEIMMIRGRALEWLGDFPTAREVYRAAAEYDNELRPEATRRLELLESLLVASTLAGPQDSLTEFLDALGLQNRELAQYVTRVNDDFYRALARREQERTEVARAEILAGNHHLLPDGEEQALGALRALVEQHRDSARAMEHALRLARYHRQLAEDELRLNPPERRGFAPDRFRTNFNAATDLLYRVSQADGRPEKVLAARELDAVLALGDYASARGR